MFQQILHGLFLAFSSDRYHVFLKFHCIFQYILFVGFQYVLSSIFLLHASYHFHRFPLWLFVPFPLVFCISCIFNIFFQEFYLSPSFSDPFCTISSRCYHIFLHFHCLFPTCLLHRHSLFLAFAPVSSIFQGIFHGLFLAFAPFSRGFCTISSDRYHVFLQFHCIFQYILMVSPATKKADLGGIDTPPSANCLVVHNPAKCSVFSRSTQGHGEISFPFGNHPPPHPLFSLRSQTATSQLAGFRNIWSIMIMKSIIENPVTSQVLVRVYICSQCLQFCFGQK